jgi:ABC-2 type transport system permease protein
VAQESVLRKTQFPRVVVPLAVVLTALFNLALNLVVVLVFLLAFGVDPHWTWLLAPLLLAVLLAFTVAVSMAVSALYPRFRDIGIIWTVASTALFYATPVLYPLEKVSVHLRDVIALNPLTPIFVELHRWVVDPSAPTIGQLGIGGWRLAVAAAIFAAVCAFGAWVFRREAPRVAEAL